jgi:hypothetical protein
VTSATHLVAEIEGHARGSRHDAYVVEVEP